MRVSQKTVGRIYVSIMTVILLFTIFQACRKIDIQQSKKDPAYFRNRFFDIPANTDPTARKIAEALKQLDDKLKFSSKIGTELGFPIWNKTLGFILKSKVGKNSGGGSSPDTLVYVPIASDASNVEITGIDDQVKGFFGCVIKEDSIDIKLFRGDYYKHYGRTNKLDTLSAESVSMMCMLLEARSFANHDTFSIDDPKLFYDTRYQDSVTKQIILNTEITGGGGSEGKVGLMTPITTAQICISVRIDAGLAGFKTAGTGVIQICYNVSQWVNFIIEGENHITIINPIGGAINSSGGYTFYDPPNCALFPQGSCGDPYLGWHHTQPTNLDYDPFHADTVGIEDEDYFRDSFPCTYALLKDSILNPNVFSQWKMLEIFDTGILVNLKYKMSPTLNQDSAVAVTRNWNTYVDANGRLHFSAITHLNKYFYERMTQEAKVANILHESIHAYINYMFKRYEQGLCDSTELKSLFPDLWNYYRGFRNTTEAQQHKTMMQKYIQALAKQVAKAYNNTATQNQKNVGSEAISWAGLTQRWGFVGLDSNRYIHDSCRIRAMIYAAQHANESLSSLIGGLLNCSGTYNMPYTDSLGMKAPCK
jgi:hypothetical protein